MAPRAGFRGRGGRGGGGRGRGRGRGGRGFGKRPRFDSARLAETKDESEAEEESSDESSVPEEPEDTSDAGSDEEVEQATTAKPYMALIKSFTESSGNSAPQAKRRKLDHSGPDETTSRQVDESSDEDGAGDDVDQVDEPEEEPEEVMAGDESDEDDEPDSSDPFETHFAAPDETESSTRLKAVQKGEWKSKRNLDKILRIVQEEPKDSDFTSLAPISRLSDLKLKQRLHQVMSSKHPELDRAEQRVAPFLFNYHDALYCNRNATNGDSIRRMICLHAVNHVFKTRDRVIKNNARLARDGNEDLELRDQGFTRPKVLVLLPTRQSCVKMVQMMCSICDPDQQENRKRFDDSYTDSEKKFSDDKPSDFRDLFEGNDDDMFRIGVKFTRKTIKYFAQFYNSDILFASPLGLRLAIGSEEDKKLDYDFLSSIEMVIVDQADALLMQNWEHMEYIFEHLNLQPKDAHGCDFSRVRSWYLDNQAKYFRQTVIFSAFNTPELSELFRTHCQNWQGRHRVQPEYPGYLQQLEVKLRQTFLRFDSESVIKEPEDRFSYFTKAVVPTLAKRAKDATGTLIFIPSYLDFVKVRNYFATSSAVANVSFGTISEYADVPEASRARSHFLNGRHKVLLYTERAHHFRRYQLRGVQRIIMYGLPDNPLFYKEIVGGYLSRSEQDLRLEPGTGHVKVMFSKYDVLKLERIVGTERVGKILKAAGDTFDFIS